MKIQMTSKIRDDNGNEIDRTIEKEAVIPDIPEYGDKESFYEVFHRYAKPTLQIRNELAEEITEVSRSDRGGPSPFRPTLEQYFTAQVENLLTIGALSHIIEQRAKVRHILGRFFAYAELCDSRH